MLWPGNKYGRTIISYQRAGGFKTYASKFAMTATFEAKGNQTLATLHSLFESTEQLQDVIKVFKADVGMVQNMDRMEQYVLALKKY